jgi:PadR family transcriptional regulator PadR
MTAPTLVLLNVFLSDPTAEWYGLQVAREGNLQTGTIYLALARLEKAGWVESRWEEVDPSAAGRPRRRLYRLTAVGEGAARDALSEHLARLRARPMPGARSYRPGAVTG